MARRRSGYPRRLENWYNRELHKMVKQWQKQFQACLKYELSQYVKGGNNMLQTDAVPSDPNWVRYIQQALQLYATRVKSQHMDGIIHRLVTRYIASIDAYSENKVVTRQATTEMSTGVQAINPLEGNPNLQHYAQQRIVQNVSKINWGSAMDQYKQGKQAENEQLIQKMRDNYVDQLQSDIYRDINTGGGVSSISHDISSRTGMTLRHATLIANDQTGSILSEMDAYRNKETGQTSYIWRTVGDDRVRPEHQALDGKQFDYDDPDGGDEGQLPGEPINCRCWQDPPDDE